MKENCVMKHMFVIQHLFNMHQLQDRDTDNFITSVNFFSTQLKCITTS